MSANQESLRDLIESRAARDGIALRKLWGWTLDAIARGVLVPTLPEGISLDTPLGGSLTWRKLIDGALAAIEGRSNPSNYNWARVPTFEPAAFDNWLDSVLQALAPPEPSRLPARRRPRSSDVRRVVLNYVDTERKAGRFTSILRLWEYVKKELPAATRDQAIKALRVIEGGPKNRGRPRVPQRPNRNS